MKKIYIILSVISMLVCTSSSLQAYSDIDQYNASAPIHILSFSPQSSPQGLSPSIIKSIYHLPETGGNGTIAIITAYHNSHIESDLSIFSKEFSIAECTKKNKCLEEHMIKKNTKEDSGWALETSLDVEWSHAIAPKAKILIVEAASPSGPNLLKAIDYARNRSDVVAVSMSWGGPEFAHESNFDNHFTSTHPIAFFASSGDSGHGVSWPAVSNNVIAVGGTRIIFSNNNTFKSEIAWEGSGGGVSVFEKEPSYQVEYSLKKNHTMRSIPDVSYNSDPHSGFSVYSGTQANVKANKHHKRSTSDNGWYVVGGTSAGSPQWAAIQSLGLSTNHQNLYADRAKKIYKHYFRDIIKGSNGNCTFYCDAHRKYNYVTGLGSPVTFVF